jgi:Holliday junction resolvase-like predicted endonuclease
MTLLASLIVPLLMTLPGSATDPVGVWPLQPQPEVVRGFDPPDSPYGAGHRGVDLLGSVGQPVLAALPGTVTFAGLLAGRGVVVVDHGATRTTYQPVAADVTVGTVVAAGAPLGTLELAGSHCFPRACLHWGWIEGRTYLDPLRLVGAGPVRLLPLWRDRPVAGPAGLHNPRVATGSSQGVCLAARCSAPVDTLRPGGAHDMTTTAASRRALGRYGETLAARLLTETGMVLLDRNWRCSEGELDLVLRDGDTLVACEVKTRRSDWSGSPHEAVDDAKLDRLHRLLRRWAEEHHVHPEEARVDLVAVLRPRRGPAVLDHVRGLF